MKKKSIINTILVTICLLLCFYVSIEVIHASKEKRPPSFFNLSISYVPTNSMEEVIMAGDYILFTKASFDDVKENDIVIYKSKEGNMAGNFIVHRIIEKHDDYLVTKGDNNPIADNEKITSDMIYGKYICRITFMNFLSNVNRNLLIGILLFIFLVLIILQAISIYVKYQREKLALKQEEAKKKMIEEIKKEILEEEKNKNLLQK